MAGQSVQELIVKYRADVSELQGKVEQIEKALTKSGKAGEDAGKKIKKGLDDASQSASPLGKAFEGLGEKIAAAFALGSILAFASESVKAFEDAEKAAVKLQTAVGVSGGLQKDFDNLVKQSKELEKISIFSDDTIQGAQTIALQFGLTAGQTERLLPLVADFASATGQDLNSALQDVLNGVNGVGKSLKNYGILLNEGATATENLDRITDQLTKKYEGQAEIVGNTAFGAHQKLKNELNNEQEVIGEKLVPAYNALLQSLNIFVDGVIAAENDLENVFTGKIFEGDSFEAKFKRRFDLVKQANADTTTENITAEINKLFEAEKKLTGDARTNALAQISALQSVLKERQKVIPQTDAEFTAKDKLTKLTDEQLKAERALANEKTGVAARTQVQLIDREIEARKKAAEQAEKDKAKQDKLDAEKEKEKNERLKREEKGLSDALQIDLAHLDEEKQREIALEGRSTAELLLIDKKYALEKQKLLEGDPVKLAQVAAEIEAINTKIQEQAKKDRIQASEDVTAANKKKNEQQEKDDKESAAKRKQINDALIQSSVQAINDFIDFSIAASRRNTDEQLNNVQNKLDADLAAIDEEQAKAEGTFKKKTAIEIKFEAQRKALREKAAAEERKLKTDQARKEKEAAIIKAIINTAVAVTEVLAVPVLAAIVAALGAVEIGLIAAQPIPQFAKGTKGAKGGLSMVGEKGAELMFVPSQAKILPNDKVNRYSEMIDSMYDSTIDNYILNKYVAPALKKQQQISQSFAQNVTNSIDTTRLAYDIAYALRDHKVELSQDNIDTLSKAITQNLPQNNPRKW